MTGKSENYKILEKFCFDLGVSLFGVADITKVREEFCLDEELRVQFDRAISLGKRIIDSVIEEIKDRPTPLYFHHYRQLNYFLDRTALLLSSYIQESGFKALPVPASQIIDWEKQRAHVSHKKIGLLAGLGWIGRNNLLVNPKFGARFRLVTVLTDMPLEADKPLSSDCGQCQRCLAPCPAQAIKEHLEDFDHKSCYKKLSEFKSMNLVSQHICGVCVRACQSIQKY